MIRLETKKTTTTLLILHEMEEKSTRCQSVPGHVNDESVKAPYSPHLSPHWATVAELLALFTQIVIYWAVELFSLKDI